MTEKLREIIERFDEISRQMELPENYSDPEAYSRLARSLKELAPAAQLAREYFAALDDMREAEALFSDAELGEVAREEFEDAKRRSEAPPPGSKTSSRRATRTTSATSSSRYARASAARRARSSRTASTACTACTPRPGAGRYPSPTSTRRGSAA